MAVSETRVRPPEFIEAAGKTFLEDLSSAVGDFKGADLSQVYGAQNVAGLDPLQQEAVKQLQSGIGAYEPYIQAAGAATGPTGYQQFMSPYQQDVIDATLQEYDTLAHYVSEHLYINFARRSRGTLVATATKLVLPMY